ncbi:ThiF family adenylyltransferase [Streptomyces sp. NPDC017958]|uniref:ThiF family adenylyltransferase n=1 Tax=Streptomyces sp. NPDC017958 TaxID=3365021 RepID=UPI003792A0C3
MGAGAVGGFLAEELARLGFSPLRLVDPDVLEVENLIRHPLGAPALGQPKASGLAGRIRREFPPCEATGVDADFLKLPDGEQLRLAEQAEVVVAATDSARCQRRVNTVALAAGKPAVYPAVWVDVRVRDAEVGEILWVLPGRRTPCYECAAEFRNGAADAQAARGARVDIQLVALATAQVVAALADPDDEHAAILDPQRTAIYLHGLTPTSSAIRAAFPTGGLESRNVRIPFPDRPCPACHGSRPTTWVGGTVRTPRDEREGAPWAQVAAFLTIVFIVMLLFLVLAGRFMHTGLAGRTPTEPMHDRLTQATRHLAVNTPRPRCSAVPRPDPCREPNSPARGARATWLFPTRLAPSLTQNEPPARRRAGTCGGGRLYVAVSSTV